MNVNIVAYIERWWTACAHIKPGSVIIPMAGRSYNHRRTYNLLSMNVVWIFIGSTGDEFHVLQFMGGTNNGRIYTLVNSSSWDSSIIIDFE